MTFTDFRKLQAGDRIVNTKTGRALTVVAQYGSHVKGERDGQTFAVMSGQAANYIKVEETNA